MAGISGLFNMDELALAISSYFEYGRIINLSFQQKYFLKK